MEASGKHLGSIWEASGKHLEGIWEGSGKGLGEVRGDLGPQAILEEEITKIIVFLTFAPRPGVSCESGEPDHHDRMYFATF